MAGLMDADGTYCITSCVHKTLGHKLYDPCVRLASSFKPVLTWAVKHFGGTIYHHKITHTSVLPRWDWSTDAYKHSEWFIRTIRPYIVLKKKSADILLEFYGLYRQQVPKKRQELYEELSAINHRDSITTETQELPFKKNLINAYFAGFFDGEAHVSFRPNNGYDGFRLELGNISRPLLEKLQCEYGGYVYDLDGESRQGDNRRPMFSWNLSKKADIEMFLLKIIPYLIVKRDDAKKMLNGVRGNKIQSELNGDIQSVPVGTPSI